MILPPPPLREKFYPWNCSKRRCAIAWRTSFDRPFDFRGKIRREDRFESARELSRMRARTRWYFNARLEAGEIDLLGGGEERGERSSEAAVTRSKPRDNLEENAARGEKRWNKDRGRGKAGKDGSKVHGRNAWYVEDDHEETDVPNVPKDFALRLQERSANFSYTRVRLFSSILPPSPKYSWLLPVFPLERRDPPVGRDKRRDGTSGIVRW